MRVAALYDVHGNLPALEAVVAELEREVVDLVVSGGDLMSGPMAAECVERLRALGDRVVWIRGNADREAAPGTPPGELGALTFETQVDGLGTVLFCHGSPRSDEEILTKLSSEERVAEILTGVNADVVVCGHTHVQFDRRVAGFRLINAGSVGMPYEGRRGAFWALLGPEVELRRTEYDIEAATEAMRATGYPADDQIGWLLNPEDPDDVSAYFEGQAGA